MLENVVSFRWLCRKGNFLLALTTVVVGGALVVPGAAGAATNVGGGVATGTAHFAEPIPAAPGCGQTSFTLSGDTSAFTLTTVDPSIISGYGGDLAFSGSGESVGCESAEAGAGQLTISAKGDDSVDCPALAGQYTRVAPHVIVNASGDCTINGVSAFVDFNFEGEFVPTNVGGGVTAPVTDATFAGTIAVFP